MQVEIFKGRERAGYLLPDLGIRGILAFKYNDLTLLNALEVSSPQDDMAEW